MKRWHALVPKIPLCSNCLVTTLVINSTVRWSRYRSSCLVRHAWDKHDGETCVNVRRRCWIYNTTKCLDLQTSPGATLKAYCYRWLQKSKDLSAVNFHPGNCCKGSFKVFTPGDIFGLSTVLILSNRCITMSGGYVTLKPDKNGTYYTQRTFPQVWKVWKSSEKWSVLPSVINDKFQRHEKPRKLRL